MTLQIISGILFALGLFSSSSVVIQSLDGIVNQQSTEVVAQAIIASLCWGILYAL